MAVKIYSVESNVLDRSSKPVFNWIACEKRALACSGKQRSNNQNAAWLRFPDNLHGNSSGESMARTRSRDRANAPRRNRQTREKRLLAQAAR